MKKILIFFTAIVGLFYISSCSNDFDLVTDWKDIPVVYGVISRADTAMYVRVEKAFVDPETSALQLAQIADSIYYPNATVRLVRGANGEESYDFIKIDGNNDGYPREAGLFANSPNWLYKLKLPEGVEFVENGTYELIVNRDETSIPVTATTKVVSDLRIEEPLESASLSFRTGSKTDFQWKFNRDNAAFFDAYIHFNYSEEIDGEDVDKSFTWQVGFNELPDGGVSPFYEIKIPGEDFYIKVASEIDGSASITRKFRFIELEVVAGGQDFKDYLDVNNVNTGITSSQLIPNYTNFTEGYGLFASVNRVSAIKLIQLETRDSLRNGYRTQHLNFQ